MNLHHETIDESPPSPARLSAFLRHTPSTEVSLAGLVAVMTLLSVVGFAEYPNGAARPPDERFIVGGLALLLPVLLSALLVSNLAWLWRGRYPVRYGYQAGFVGGVACLLTSGVGHYYDEPLYGLAFGLGASGGLWYLTLRTHGAAPVVWAVPLALLTPAVGLAVLWGDDPVLGRFGAVALASLVLASYGFIAFIDGPYRRAVGVRGTRHMAAFIRYFSTGDGRALTEALREICQVVTMPGGWVSLRRDDEPLAFLAVPGLHPGPVGDLGGSNLPAKIEPHLPGLAFALHGASTNDHNPLRAEDVFRMGQAMADDAAGAEHTSAAPPACSHGGVTALGLGGGLLMCAAPGDNDDILPEVAAMVEGVATRGGGERLLVDLHTQEGWGNQPVAAGTAPALALAHDASQATEDCRAATTGELRAGVAHVPGEDLARGVGPGGLRVLAMEVTGRTSALLLWDANGCAPGTGAALREALDGMVDELVIGTTDNHYVNTERGGHNPLADPAALAPMARQALQEALDDLAPAEAAMGRVAVEGVEILGQGQQDRISAAVNAVVQVARFSWIPLYGAATFFTLWARGWL